MDTKHFTGQILPDEQLVIDNLRGMRNSTLMNRIAVLLGNGSKAADDKSVDPLSNDTLLSIHIEEYAARNKLDATSALDKLIEEPLVKSMDTSKLYELKGKVVSGNMTWDAVVLDGKKVKGEDIQKADTRCFELQMSAEKAAMDPETRVKYEKAPIHLAMQYRTGKLNEETREYAEYTLHHESYRRIMKSYIEQNPEIVEKFLKVRVERGDNHLQIKKILAENTTVH
jgi:hypothetical protein